MLGKVSDIYSGQKFDVIELNLGHFNLAGPSLAQDTLIWSIC